MATILHQSIPQKRYISTTTVISGDDATTTSRREFIGRVFGTNELLPYGKVVEFANVDAVREWFGINADGSDKVETEFADKYFGIVGNNGDSPEKISFCRWSGTATAAYLMPKKVEVNISAYQHCSDTSIVFNYQLADGIDTCNEVVAFDPSILTSVIPVGSTTSGTLLEMLNSGFAASNSAVLKECVASYADGRFKIAFPEEVKYLYACSGNDSSVAGTQYSLAYCLGLTTEKAVVCSDYAGGEDEAAALTRSADISDNFGSFCFLEPELSRPVMLVYRTKLIMEWLASRKYDMLAVQRAWYTNSGTGLSPIASLADGVTTKTGIHIVAGNTANGYCCEEALPMAILACTKYDGTEDNANVNWMFVSAPKMTSAVTMENWANNLDAYNVNYLGQTQSVAQIRNFYQRGVNFDGQLASVYCAEMWLRDRIGAAITAGFINIEKVSSVDTSQVSMWLQSVFSVAASNGTFNKPEETIDKATRLVINNYFGGVDNAWEELQKDGYGCQLSSEKTTKGWKVTYRLAYFHHSQIFKLEGTHTIKGV